MRALFAAATATTATIATIATIVLTACSESWIPVAGLERCHAERLASQPDRFVSRWEPCGAHCRRRSAVPHGLTGSLAERGASAAQAVNGVLYVRTSIAGADARYEIIERAGEDTPELVLRFDADCHVTHQKAGAAMLLEMFRDPREHFAAVYAPEDGSLSVSPGTFEVALPVTGWFLSEEGFGVADARGVDRYTNGVRETLARSSAWLLSPKSANDRVAWIDWGAAPASIVERGVRAPSEGDVAAFAFDRSSFVAVEVFGPSALAGVYERSVLRDGATRVELTGRVAGAIAIEASSDDVGLTTPGDGASIPPAFLLVDRVHRQIEEFTPPPGKFWQLAGTAGTAGGQWLLEEYRDPVHFESWIIRTP